MPSCPTRQDSDGPSDTGRSPCAKQGKIDLLARQADIVDPHAHTVAQAVSLARVLPYQTEAFRVKSTIIGQPGNVYQALDEEGFKFHEQPELRHAGDHTIVLLAHLIEHEFDFFELFDLTFGIVREAFARRGRGGDVRSGTD